jgi:4'-phosphopantetheinyl transferase
LISGLDEDGTVAKLDDFPGLPSDIVLRQVHWRDFSELDAEAILSAHELSRRAEMKHSGRRNGFTLGRIALRTLISSQLKIPAQEVVLEVAPTGQLFSPGSGLHVSLAHSGDAALAAVARRPIGIDLEEVRKKPDTLLDYILSDMEKDHVYKLDVPDSHRLFLCWTLKESVLKGLGVGLRSSPKKVTIEVDMPSRTAHLMDPNDHAWEARFCISEQWVSALAFKDD